MIRFLVAILSTMMIADAALSQAPVFSETGEQALAKVQAGDTAGAIALLEPLRGSGGATGVDLALLGTLYQETGNAQLAFEVLQPLADVATADAAVLYNAGRAAGSVGDSAASVRYFERSVALIPDSPAARELGLIRGSQGRLAEAYPMLSTWVRANPDDVVAASAAAVCALRLGRIQDAEVLIAALPENPRTLFLRGRLLMKQGDPMGALEILVPMIDDHPSEITADLYLVCADAYVQTGRSKDAVLLLRKFQKPGPRIANKLADALYRSGELEAAIATLAPFAEPLPELETSKVPIAQQIILDYGRMLVASGRQADALPYLERSTQIDPEQKLAWKGLGEALIALGRSDEGRVALQRFQELTTTQTERRREAEVAANDPAAPSLAEAHKAIQEGKGEEALVVLRREIAIYPEDLRPRLLEVQALLSLGRSEDALRASEITLATFPDHPDAIYQRGAMRLGLNQHTGAEQDFRHTLELAPDHIAAMSDLAVLLEFQGEVLEAQRLLEKLIAIRPEDESFRQRLDELR